MRLDWAILSTAAEAREGLASMLSGGWDTSFRPEFPAPFIGAVTVRALFNRTEAGRSHPCEMHFLDEDGKPFAPTFRFELRVDVSPSLPQGWDIPALASITLNGMIIPKPGLYSVEILMGGNHVKSSPSVSS